MTIDEFAATLSPELGELATDLHQELMQIYPQFVTDKKWTGLAYKRHDDYSCMVTGYGDHLKIMLWRGTMITDNHGLLKGTGSNTRHIKLRPFQPLPTDALKDYLHQQFNLFDSGIHWEGD